MWVLIDVIQNAVDAMLEPCHGKLDRTGFFQIAKA